MLLSICLHDQRIFEFESEDTHELASVMNEWIASTRVPSVVQQQQQQQQQLHIEPVGHETVLDDPPQAIAQTTAAALEPSEYEVFLVL